MVVVSLLPRISIATSPGSSLHDVLLSMRFGLTQRHLSLKRPFTNYSITSVSPEQLKSPVTMATTESQNLVEASKEETNKKEKEIEDKKKEEVSVPPPPEKPEPGDCCGSGCVRCVWDVYYEELEDYNNKLSGETKSI
ncbi:Oxidoreductase-like N-terminal [Arabidopsis suecica]|uniref:Oxidoreductase-like N-terminal n=1 Tax=Arabidopsis suecica TaxID=45249 RepID=A0A8T1Z8Y3_ARASU|nr:Oxidoreductase-like N-terminal [Arabidopsis suecica]